MSRQVIGKRRKVEEKVDISDLQFGDDFKDAEAMMNSEVKVRRCNAINFLVEVIDDFTLCRLFLTQSMQLNSLNSMIWQNWCNVQANLLKHLEGFRFATFVNVFHQIIRCWSGCNRTRIRLQSAKRTSIFSLHLRSANILTRFSQGANRAGAAQLWSSIHGKSDALQCQRG